MNIRLLYGLFCAVLAGITALAVTAIPASAQTQLSWSATGSIVQQLDQTDPATAAHFYNTPLAYGTGNTPGTDPVQSGFTAVPTLHYASYAQFAADVADGAISPAIKAVIYDPESWDQTPTDEQQNPALYMQLFGDLAQANGYTVLMEPARDLGQTDTACPDQPNWTLDQWYINCDIAGDAAEYSNVVMVQTQADTTNVSAFDTLFNTARQQALTANPAVQVDDEVSTTYGTASQMAAAAQSVSPNGTYMTASSTTIGLMDSFLQDMQSAGY